MGTQPNLQIENKTDQGAESGRRAFLLSSIAALPLFARRKILPVTPLPKRLVRFKQDRFCISFWVDPPADEQRYAQIAAANFTVVMGGFGAKTEKADKNQLDLCQKYGMKALVYLQGYEDGAVFGPADAGKIQQADKFPNHPACWGYMLHDEPNARLFPNLRYMVNHLRRVRPGRLGFINLFPTYATNTTLGASTYDEYVSRFVREVNPDVLCMDYYPMMEPHLDTRDGYCANLSVLRKYALRQNIPFWNFFNAMAFGPHSCPTEAQIRWQIYSSLAYGAKGVLYFCYWTPRGLPHGGNALIGADGHPTHRYNQARRINARLKNLGPTLMQLISETVYRVMPNARPTTVLRNSPIKSLTPGDYLIGVFKHADGRTAVLLNNYSYCFTARPTVVFAAPAKNIVEVDQDTGEEIRVMETGRDGSGLLLSLGSAEGRLFLINR